jgi:hypothetical protein
MNKPTYGGYYLRTLEARDTAKIDAQLKGIDPLAFGEALHILIGDFDHVKFLSTSEGCKVVGAVIVSNTTSSDVLVYMAGEHATWAGAAKAMLYKYECWVKEGQPIPAKNAGLSGYR